MNNESFPTRNIASLNLSIFNFFLLTTTISCVDPSYEACVPKNCGNQTIKYPFWIKDEQDPFCGYPGFELICQNNYPIIQTPNNSYTVQSFFYNNQSLRVSATAVLNLESDCLPPISNVSLEPGKFAIVPNGPNLILFSKCSTLPDILLGYRISGCGNRSWELAMFGDDAKLGYALESCQTKVLSPVEVEGGDGIGDYLDLLRRGFLLKWKALNCSRCAESGGWCGVDSSTYQFRCFCPDRPHMVRCTPGASKRSMETKLGVVIGSALVVVLTILALFCYFGRHSSGKSFIFWKKGNEIHRSIEDILKNCGPLAPKRYSYSDVKKMTNSFKEKLGQGGYGQVYKGKLKNGSPVAVKFLKESKGNGEEFGNEVTSISRTAHINIVTLLGFCLEGRKRALIYEFMPNGSLDKFIYDENPSLRHQLGWATLYQIAIGIARGLEYLHRGCNTQILHFDIKPHNILLDKDFCPKISDFGLAKLCPEIKSNISMSGARGTAGYIAPEVFSRNFGRVSHKSDVYSYGMMILDMVGGRKNVDVGVDHTTEYFPDWIYRGLELVEEIGQHNIMNEEENGKSRKMMIVGLWCIQTDPFSRPAMTRVVSMLEGSLESLTIPPRPFLSSLPRAPVDSSDMGNLESCSV